MEELDLTNYDFKDYNLNIENYTSDELKKMGEKKFIDKAWDHFKD